jgi:hypothetical protein
LIGVGCFKSNALDHKKGKKVMQENIVVTSISSFMFDYAYKYIGDKTKLIFQATSMRGPVVTPMMRLILIVVNKSSQTTWYHPKPCEISV